METSDLNNENLKKCIDSLRCSIQDDSSVSNPDYLLLPRGEKILNRKRYHGKGRPRNFDYDYKEIDWFSYTKEIIKK